jgi:hypothetical protein
MTRDSSPELTRRRFVGWGTALLGSVGLAGCSFPVDSRTITRSSDRTFDPGAATAFTLDNHNGDVTLDGGDGSAVSGEVTKRSTAGEKALDRVTVTETVSDGTLAVATESEGSHNVSVDFDLSVPDSLAVTAVTSDNGDVDVTGVTGDGTYETTNGDVTVADVDGSVTAVSKNGDAEVTDPARLGGARSTNGDVEADAPALDGDTRCATTNGDVTVAVPDDLDATVDLRTENGDAEIDGATVTVEQSGDRRIRGRLGEGGPLLELRSTNGDVTLTDL